jgi:hypothetical protein
LLAGSPAGVPTSARGGKLRVIACIEDPWLAGYVTFDGKFGKSVERLTLLTQPSILACIR